MVTEFAPVADVLAPDAGVSDLAAVVDETVPVDALDTLETEGESDEAGEPDPWETDEARTRITQRARQILPSTLDKFKRAYGGDAEAKKGMSSWERAAYREWTSGVDELVQSRAQQVQTVSTDEARYFTDYDRLIQMDTYSRGETLQGDPKLMRWWADVEAWKQEIGLPPDATVQQVQAAHYAAKQQIQAPAPSGPLDPVEVYRGLSQEPEWRALSQDQRDSLDPDNFDHLGNDAAISKAVLKAFGKLTANVRVPAEPEPEPTLGQQARAMARGLPPSVGGQPKGRQSFESITDAYLADPSNPAKRDAYLRARPKPGGFAPIRE